MGTSTRQAPYTTQYRANIPAAGATADTETTVFIAPHAGTITAVQYVPVAAITGAATNHRIFSVVNKGAAGAGTTAAASLTMDNGVNAAAYDAKAITLSGTAANLDIAQGDVVTFKSLHVLTGIADPGGTVFIDFLRD